MARGKTKAAGAKSRGKMARPDRSAAGFDPMKQKPQPKTNRFSPLGPPPAPNR